LVAANGWDQTYLDELRRHPLVTALGGQPADGGLQPADLVTLSHLFPRDWFTDGAAVGTAPQCAARLHRYLAAGADEIVIHGSTPDLLAPVLDAFASNSQV
jgi:hypothetical protein